MAKQKEIKFYIHHQRFVDIAQKEVKGKSKFRVWAWLKFFALVFFEVCYQFGSAIISLIAKLTNAAAKDIQNTKQAFFLRLKRASENKALYGLVVFLITCLLVWGLVAALLVVANGLGLKASILKNANLGNSYLEDAKTNLSNNDLEKAQSSFTKAFQTFSQGRAQINQSGVVLNSLISLLPQTKAAKNLLESAELVSSAGQDLLPLDSVFQNLSISPVGITSKSGTNKENLDALSEALNKASIKIARASNLISQTDAKNLPADKREQFNNLKEQLTEANKAIQNLNSLTLLLKDIFEGQKNILLLFENNNELRPGGGFIGTYGILKSKDGFISSLKISSIYDLDGQLLAYIKPPTPLLNVGPRWYMRDSNWFADFPTSAKKASDFFEQEAGLTPDLVVAITPNLIQDLLTITGPIELPKYHVTLSAENFVELTQVQTTLSNELPTNSPKQILADLFPILLQKLGEMDKSKWGEVILAIQKELSEKQIALYSRDEQIQTSLANFGWDGSLQKSDRDYLAIVSANLGGTKTDLQIEQKVKLTTQIDKEGNIVNNLQIIRTNLMPDLPQMENFSYIRVLVPQGSELISNSGFDENNLSFPGGKKYKIDDDVLAWEQNSVTDNLTGTRIGQESGKTFYANWLRLAGKESKTIFLSYKLPFKIQDVDRYSLLVQKQIGALPYGLNWTFNFPSRSLEWKNFETSQFNTNSLNSDIIINTDVFLGAVLQKQ